MYINSKCPYYIYIYIYIYIFARSLWEESSRHLRHMGNRALPPLGARALNLRCIRCIVYYALYTICVYIYIYIERDIDIDRYIYIYRERDIDIDININIDTDIDPPSFAEASRRAAPRRRAVGSRTRRAYALWFCVIRLLLLRFQNIFREFRT